jgi:MoxR-like ATPase
LRLQAFAREETTNRTIQGLTTGTTVNNLEPCITLAEVQAIRLQCQQVKVEPSIQQYIVDLVCATRNDREISLGVSPRGAVALHKATQAWAWLHGRSYDLPDDVKDLALYVLAHRIMPISGRRGTQMIERLLQTVTVDRA